MAFVVAFPPPVTSSPPVSCTHAPRLENSASSTTCTMDPSPGASRIPAPTRYAIAGIAAATGRPWWDSAVPFPTVEKVSSQSAAVVSISTGRYASTRASLTPSPASSGPVATFRAFEEIPHSTVTVSSAAPAQLGKFARFAPSETARTIPSVSPNRTDTIANSPSPDLEGSQVHTTYAASRGC